MSSQDIMIKLGLGVSRMFFSGIAALVGIPFPMAVKESESIRKYPATAAFKIIIVFTTKASSVIDEPGDTVSVGSKTSDGGIIKVKTKSFMEFVLSNQIHKIDFLKVDCEGGEYDIFIEDNASFLRERVNKIALEYHGPYHGIIKFLKENEFTVEHGDLNDTLGIIYAKNNSQKIK